MVRGSQRLFEVGSSGRRLGEYIRSWGFPEGDSDPSGGIIPAGVLPPDPVEGDDGSSRRGT